MNKDLREILITEDKIRETVSALAKRINADYAGKTLILMIILKGSAVFSTDLMRMLDMNVMIDFMQVSSYGMGSVSGELVITKD